MPTMLTCTICKATKKENADPRFQGTVAMIELPLYAICESESQCDSLFHSEFSLGYEIGGNYDPFQPTGSNTKQPYVMSCWKLLTKYFPVFVSRVAFVVTVLPYFKLPLSTTPPAVTPPVLINLFAL